MLASRWGCRPRQMPMLNADHGDERVGGGSEHDGRVNSECTLHYPFAARQRRRRPLSSSTLDLHTLLSLSAHSTAAPLSRRPKPCRRVKPTLVLAHVYAACVRA